MLIKDLREEMQKYWRPEKAEFLQKYFFAKDGNASKEIFRGISVPNSRVLAKKYKDLSFTDLEILLNSNVHEEKLHAIIILTLQYEKGTAEVQDKVVEFFLKNTKYIDDWDLVDTGAYKILGNYLLDKPKDVLYKLAHSESWWERRIAMIATFEFIKNGTPDETFKIANILLNDKHDLIHKAVGWMLREVGSRISIEKEEQFLNDNYKKMPRTMLRYAIEKFSNIRRMEYLKGTA